MAALLCLMPEVPCRGDLLSFHFAPDGPTFLGSGGSLSYDASTGEFQSSFGIQSFTTSILPGDSETFAVTDGKVMMDLYVKPDGTFWYDGTGIQVTGSMTIGGTVISGTLLSGDFFEFGADPPGTPSWVSKMLIDPTGGKLDTNVPLMDGTTLPAQFPPGVTTGVAVFADSADTGTLGDFTSSFSSSSVSGQIGAITPEPSTALLTGIGLALLTFLSLRRRPTAPAA
jgi:hypothetical protein